MQPSLLSICDIRKCTFPYICMLGGAALSQKLWLFIGMCIFSVVQCSVCCVVCSAQCTVQCSAQCSVACCVKFAVWSAQFTNVVHCSALHCSLFSAVYCSVVHSAVYSAVCGCSVLQCSVDRPGECNGPSRCNVPTNQPKNLSRHIFFFSKVTPIQSNSFCQFLKSIYCGIRELLSDLLTNFKLPLWIWWW